MKKTVTKSSPAKRRAWRRFQGLLLLLILVTAPGCGGCFSQNLPTTRAWAKDDEPDPPPPAPAPVADPAAAPKGTPAANPAVPAVAQTQVVAPTTSASVTPDASVPAPLRLADEAPLSAPSTILVRRFDTGREYTPQEQMEEAIKRMRRIVLALDLYARTRGNGRYPPYAVFDENKKLLLSWRVTILPELGYEDLYKRFNQKQAWDSPVNKELLKQIPVEYQATYRFDDRTNILGVRANGALFGSREGTARNTIVDLLENTMFLVECDEPSKVAWTAPIDYTPPKSNPVARLGRLRDRAFLAAWGNGNIGRIPVESQRSSIFAAFSVAGKETFNPISISRNPMDVLTVNLGTTVVEPVGELPKGTMFPEIPGATSALLEDTFSAEEREWSLDNKLPTPETKLEKMTREKIMVAYKTDIARVKGPQDRVSLLRKMYKDGEKLEAEPNEFFSLMHIVRDAAIKMGDYTMAMDCANELANRYKVDEFGTKFGTFTDVTKSKFAFAPDHASRLNAEGKKLLEQAKDKDNFDAAEQILDILTRASRNQTGGDAWKQDKKEIEEIKKAFSGVPQARETLKKDPADRDANFVVGRYNAFVKFKFREGMRNLARIGAKNPLLSSAASSELQGVQQPDEMINLGDLYYEQIGPKEQQPWQTGVYARAYYWYQKAAAQASGVELIKSQNRRDEILKLFNGNQEFLKRVLARDDASLLGG